MGYFVHPLTSIFVLLVGTQLTVYPSHLHVPICFTYPALQGNLVTLSSDKIWFSDYIEKTFVLRP